MLGENSRPHQDCGDNPDKEAGGAMHSFQEIFEVSVHGVSVRNSTRLHGGLAERPLVSTIGSPCCPE